MVTRCVRLAGWKLSALRRESKPGVVLKSFALCGCPRGSCRPRALAAPLDGIRREVSAPAEQSVFTATDPVPKPDSLSLPEGLLPAHTLREWLGFLWSVLFCFLLR